MHNANIEKEVKKKKKVKKRRDIEVMTSKTFENPLITIADEKLL